MTNSKPTTDLVPPQYRTKLEEYIREGEHQDGEGYWDNFPTVIESIEDFLLYIEVSEGSQDHHSVMDGVREKIQQS